MNGKHLLGLLAIFLVAHLFLLNARPFYKDEALYAQMIDEFLRAPAVLPTYFGEAVPWKPMLLFYAYSPAVFLLSLLPIPLEIAYRLPSLFLGLAATLLTYGIARRLKLGDGAAFIAAAAYASLNLAAVTDTMLLMDPLLQALILAGLYSYLRALKDPRWLAAAFAFGALAFLTKTFASAYLPLLGLLLIFFTDRKMLTKPAFLLSLTGVAFGALLFSLAFIATGNSGILLSEYVLDAARFPPFSDTLLSKIVIGGLQFTFFTIPWLFFALYGLARTDFRKGAGVFTAYWLLLIIMPLATAYVHYWYFLPVLPALALFAARGFAPDGKLDKPTLAVLLAMLAISLYLAPYLRPDEAPEDARELGNYLAGKGPLLLVANYSPTITFYKFHQEPAPLFGSTRIVFHANSSKLSPQELHSIVYENAMPLNSSYSFQRLTDIYMTRDAVVDGPALRWDYIALDAELYDRDPSIFPDFTVAYRTQGLKYAVLKRAS